MSYWPNYIYFNFQFIIFLSLWNCRWECRPDGDTDEFNKSFEGSIYNLFNENKPCEVKDANDKWVKADAKVETTAPFPTCLKKFQEDAFMPVCGKPMYNKFKYCAKALFTGNKDYSTYEFGNLWREKRQVLILYDGCTHCRSWPKRAANITLKLFLGFDKNETPIISKVDAYGKFKIGAIFKVPEGKVLKKSIRFIQPRVEFEHRCNQYDMKQSKIMKFPVLYPFRMKELSFELLDLMVELIQQGKDKDIITLENKKIKKVFSTLTTTMFPDVNATGNGNLTANGNLTVNGNIIANNDDDDNIMNF